MGRLADLDVIEVALEHVPFERVRPLRRAREHAILPAEDTWFAFCAEGQIVCVMGLSPPRHNVRKIHGAFTVPEYRGRGLYTALLSAVGGHIDRTAPEVELRADSLPEGLGALRRAGFVEFRSPRTFKHFTMTYMRRPSLRNREGSSHGEETTADQN